MSSGAPVVSVPVLSNTKSVTRGSSSRAAASLTSTPLLAAAPVATMTAVGVASPSAQGHAMTSTLTAWSRAVSSVASRPKRQPRNVNAASVMTTGTNTALTRSASCWAGGLLACARSTIAMIRANVLSSPTWVTSKVKAPTPFSVPPETEAPGSFRTLRLSPLSIDSSSHAPPSSTTPSAGTRSCAPTRTWSPTRSASAGTSTSSRPSMR